MKLKIALIYALTLSIFIIGCQQLNDQMQTGPDDGLTVVVDGIDPDEIVYTGTVFIGDAGNRFGTDEYALNSAAITDDTLDVSVSFSGGCKEHQFTLVVSEEFLESFPVQLHAYIAHDANGDPCEAYPTENYHFDLTPIKTMYQEAYRQEAGTIVLQLKDAPDGGLVYEFTM